MALTLSWFFYLVSKNARVEQKLLGELSGAILLHTMKACAVTELNSLVYLHATL